MYQVAPFRNPGPLSDKEQSILVFITKFKPQNKGQLMNLMFVHQASQKKQLFDWVWAPGVLESKDFDCTLDGLISRGLVKEVK